MIQNNPLPNNIFTHTHKQHRIENSTEPNGIQFKPKVLDQFPTRQMIEKQYSHLTEKEIKKKTKDAIRPDQVASFAFPDNVDITYMSNNNNNSMKNNNISINKPTFFWFVLTDVSGSRFYCATVSIQ